MGYLQFVLSTAEAALMGVKAEGDSAKMITPSQSWRVMFLDPICRFRGVTYVGNLNLSLFLYFYFLASPFLLTVFE